MIRAGARGYVTKTISSAELGDAVARVAEGDAVFSPRLAGFVLDAFAAGDRVGDDAELDALTPREREVLQLIARGYPTRRSPRGSISVKTVEAHVSSVLRKLQLSSRHELDALGAGTAAHLTRPVPPGVRPPFAGASASSIFPSLRAIDSTRTAIPSPSR